jgi:hypothetical protein
VEVQERVAANPTKSQASKSAGPGKSGNLAQSTGESAGPGKSPGPGRGGKSAKERAAAERRARVREARAQAAKAERRSKALRIGGIAAVAAVGIGIVAVAAHSGGHGSAIAKPSGSAALPQTPAATGTAIPPWPVPAGTVSLGEVAGLRALNTEGEVLHFHPHLDVLVDGKPVAVPAEIGIDAAGGKISELHTHDASGVLHVEAPDNAHRYVLGQLFAEWNVRLDATHLGGLTAGGGNTLTAYVGGKQATGDPKQIELLPHREIALVFGPAGQHVTVPSSYQFPDGQ